MRVLTERRRTRKRKVTASKTKKMGSRLGMLRNSPSGAESLDQTNLRNC
jgi:hypothetical protein